MVKTENPTMTIVREIYHSESTYEYYIRFGTKEKFRAQQSTHGNRAKQDTDREVAIFMVGTRLIGHKNRQSVSSKRICFENSSSTRRRGLPSFWKDMQEVVTTHRQERTTH